MPATNCDLSVMQQCSYTFPCDTYKTHDDSCPNHSLRTLASLSLCLVTSHSSPETLHSLLLLLLFTSDLTKLTALDSPNRSLNCVNPRPFVRTSRISCTLRPCKHSCVNIHREEHLILRTLRTLMVSIRTCTDAATKDVPCKLQQMTLK